MEFQTITLKTESNIATIILNRPDSLNTVNQQVVDEMEQAIDAVADDAEVKVVIITGAGRAFSAGADFRFKQIRDGEVDDAEAEDIPAMYTDIKTGRLLHGPSRVTLKLHRLEKPTIAMVNGDTIGVALDWVLACDMRTGSEKARFNVGFTRVGLNVVCGGAWLMPRIIGTGKALEYILTGDFCNAEEAYRIGLLNKLVSAEQLGEETLALARKLAKCAPIAQRLGKLQVYEGMTSSLESALRLGAACQSIAVYSEDHREGVRAFAEKRAAQFQNK